MNIRFAGDTRVAFRSACMLAAALLAACGGGGGGAPPSNATPPADTGSDPQPPVETPEPPAQKHVDLRHWRLTVPVDAAGGTTGEALSLLPVALLGPPAYSSPWFYPEADGALTFWVPVDGAVAGSSPNPRSELREMIDPGTARVNWSAARTSRLTARCRVVKIPGLEPSVIIGQVHAYQAAHPLVTLQYLYDEAAGTGRLSAHVNSTPAATQRLTFPLAGAIPLNEAFDYELSVAQNVLTMTVNGDSAQYTLGSAWRSAGLYFKAGAYIKAGGSGGALVSFDRLDTAHD